jgi:hypothetical protein
MKKLDLFSWSLLPTVVLCSALVGCSGSTEPVKPDTYAPLPSAAPGGTDGGGKAKDGSNFGAAVEPAS